MPAARLIDGRPPVSSCPWWLAAPRALSLPSYWCAELAGRHRKAGIKLREAKSGGGSTQPAARGGGRRSGGGRAAGRRLGRLTSICPRREAAPGENGRAAAICSSGRAVGRTSRIFAGRPSSPPCSLPAAAPFPHPVTAQDQKLGRLGLGPLKNQAGSLAPVIAVSRSLAVMTEDPQLLKGERVHHGHLPVTFHLLLLFCFVFSSTPCTQSTRWQGQCSVTRWQCCHSRARASSEPMPVHFMSHPLSSLCQVICSK